MCVCVCMKIITTSISTNAAFYSKYFEKSFHRERVGSKCVLLDIPFFLYIHFIDDCKKENYNALISYFLFIYKYRITSYAVQLLNYISA